MRLFKTIIFTLAFLFAAPSLIASTPAAYLQAQMDSIKTFEATFKQTTQTPSGEAALSGAGKMAMLRPNKFYWSVQKPGKQVIVINDKELWLYDVDLAQVTIKTLQGQMAGLTPASLLSGHLSKLIAGNTIIKSSAHGVDTVRLVPKKSGGAMRWIQIQFIKGVLSGLQFENQLQQITDIQFSQIKTNQPIASSLFHPSIPRGVDVLR